MARKHDDASLAHPPLSDEVVEAYLRAHPDFLARRTHLLAEMDPPSRFPSADRVVDFQTALIAHLRDEMDRVRGAAETLIHTSRSNMSTQNRTHRSVLVLLAAETMPALSAAVAEDLPGILDVDVATLCFEETDKPLAELAVQGVFRIPPGSVEALMGGRDRDCALNEEMPGEPMLFGDGVGLVKSSALVRLTAGGRCPAGLMALGARHSRTFHSGQGTELLTFLARVVESCVRRFVG